MVPSPDERRFNAWGRAVLSIGKLAAGAGAYYTSMVADEVQVRFRLALTGVGKL